MSHEQRSYLQHFLYSQQIFRHGSLSLFAFAYTLLQEFLKPIIALLTKTPRTKAGYLLFIMVIFSTRNQSPSVFLNPEFIDPLQRDILHPYHKTNSLIYCIFSNCIRLVITTGFLRDPEKISSILSLFL